MGEDGCDYEFKGNLGNWLDRQRQAKKENILQKNEEDKLQILVDKGKS
jgi:hypothetical protein